ncbi:hypothetical protein [Thioalkalivibrio sp. ALE6]|uniref:hypothetical protein n=1 Tax=Thioalkalivibrio sp. ALE6 TaxID=1266908 RepID=UPI0003716C80|nr:hypothetical protein [Thioalkalivibrio sp. ALE6]
MSEPSLDPDGEQLVNHLLEAERELSDAMGTHPSTAPAATIGFLAVAVEDAIDLKHLKDMLRRRTLDAREHAEAERRMPPTAKQRAEAMR